LQNEQLGMEQGREADSRKTVFEVNCTEEIGFRPRRSPDFDLHVNPVLYLGAWQDSRLNHLYLSIRVALKSGYDR